MPDAKAVLTVHLADDITPAQFAEILAAFDTLHRELTGEPLRDLVVEHGGRPEFDEAIENALDVSEARHAEALAKRRGETPIPWETVRRKLDEGTDADA